MKTNIAVVLDEQQRGRIRAGLDRSGLATREEIRIFANRAIAAALEQLPEPKRRRRVAAANRAPSTLEQLAALPPATRCQHCRQALERHGKMALSCPPASGAPKGKTFTPIGEE